MLQKRLTAEGHQLSLRISQSKMFDRVLKMPAKSIREMWKIQGRSLPIKLILNSI